MKVRHKQSKQRNMRTLLTLITLLTLTTAPATPAALTADVTELWFAGAPLAGTVTGQLTIDQDTRTGEIAGTFTPVFGFLAPLIGGPGLGSVPFAVQIRDIHNMTGLSGDPVPGDLLTGGLEALGDKGVFGIGADWMFTYDLLISGWAVDVSRDSAMGMFYWWDGGLPWPGPVDVINLWGEDLTVRFHGFRPPFSGMPFEVGYGDILLRAANGTGTGDPPGQTPEPGTWAMAGLGLLVLCKLR